jgi:hypothetical protein
MYILEGEWAVMTIGTAALYRRFERSRDKMVRRESMSRIAVSLSVANGASRSDTSRARVITQADRKCTRGVGAGDVSKVVFQAEPRPNSARPASTTSTDIPSNRRLIARKLPFVARA